MGDYNLLSSMFSISSPISLFSLPSEGSIFSSTIAGAPIATVCPLGVRLGDAAGITSDMPFDFVTLPTSSSGSLTSYIVAASALMPGGSTTTFSSLNIRDVEEAAATNIVTTLPKGIDGMSVNVSAILGTILVGANGCQTLYSPTTTATCSTIITPVGLPPVTISDCNQYITFSSETLFTCAPTPTVTPRPATGNNIDLTTSTNVLSADVARSSNSPLSPLDLTSVSSESMSTTNNNITDTDTAATIIQTLPTITGSTGFDEDAADDEDIASASLDVDVSLARRELIYTTPPTDDIPMSLPRHLLPENQLRRRQILMSKGKPISTDLMTITPSMPGPTMQPAHLRRVRALDVLTELPQSPLSVPNPVNSTSDSTLNGTLISNTSSMYPPTEVPVFTKLSPVPDVLRAKHAHDAVRAVLHKRQATMETSNTSIADNTTLSITNSTTTSMPLLNDTSASSSSSVLPSIIDTDTNTTSILTMPTPANRAANLSPPQPTKYYAAPWTELTNGGIPTHVKGMICRGGLEPVGPCLTPDTDGDTELCECETVDELWSLTSMTRTRVGTTVLNFTGTAVVVDSAGSSRTTTEIAFESTVTTTYMDVVGSVVKSTVTATTSDSIEVSITTVDADVSSVADEGTVYATLTSIPSVTMTLLPGDPSATTDLNMNAAMPQSGASSLVAGMDTTVPSISYPIRTGIPISASILPATDLPVSSVSMPVESGSESADVSGDVEGTILVTSTVATETITVPPVSHSGIATGSGVATDVPVPETTVSPGDASVV